MQSVEFTRALRVRHALLAVAHGACESARCDPGRWPHLPILVRCRRGWNSASCSRLSHVRRDEEKKRMGATSTMEMSSLIIQLFVVTFCVCCCYIRC